jgi:hypothetical protein
MTFVVVRVLEPEAPSVSASWGDVSDEISLAESQTFNPCIGFLSSAVGWGQYDLILRPKLPVGTGHVSGKNPRRSQDGTRRPHIIMSVNQTVRNLKPAGMSCRRSGGMRSGWGGGVVQNDSCRLAWLTATGILAGSHLLDFLALFLMIWLSPVFGYNRP